MSDTDSKQQDRGRSADKPGEIPGSGWKDVGKRVMREVKADMIPMLSAGVAFYLFLAIPPLLIATVSIYGMIADPQTIQDQVETITASLGSGVASIITTPIEKAANSSSAGLAAIIAIAIALWSASGGAQGVIKATNVAYDEEETRGFVGVRGRALLLTVGGIVAFAIIIFLLSVLPSIFGVLGLGEIARTVLNWARWPILVIFLMVVLAIVYRIAPDRDAPQFKWVSWGAVVATLIWVIAAVAFSFYINNFASYSEQYGAVLGAIFAILLFLFVTAFIILLGAEINSEMEHQTEKDTTRGEPQPMGERDAAKADTKGEAPVTSESSSA